MKETTLEVARFVKRLIKRVGKDDISGAAAELSYRFFLALFPFFIFLGALGGFLANHLGLTNPTERIMDALGESLPPDAASVLRGQIDAVVHTRGIGLLSIGIVAAVWAASSGIGATVKVLNRVHEVPETRPIYKRWALALSLTLLGGGTLLAGFFALFLGEKHLLDLADIIGMGDATARAIALARWPAVTLVAMLAASVLYWAAPNLKRRFRLVSPGAVLFALGWSAGSAVFGLYVRHFGSYNATYGTLGGVVVALIWLYLTSFILLLGAELNVLLAERQQEAALPADEATLPAVSPTLPAPLEAPGAGERRIGPATFVIGALVGLLALRRFVRRPGRRHLAVKSGS